MLFPLFFYSILIMSIHDTLNRGYMAIKKQIIVANLNEKQYLCKKYIYGKKQNISKYGN